MTNTTPRRTSRSRFRGEKGFILALTALMIVPLVVFTAFAVDLGAWYAQGMRQQRAVDAASLAGVVQLPTESNASAAALAALRENGFKCTGGIVKQQAPPTSANPCTYWLPSSTGFEMQVGLYNSATQYFSGIVLKGEVLKRDATAVYNLHIPLGSPTNTFGNDPTRGGTQPQLWGAINGPYSNHEDGDPYATKCSGENGGTATSCGTTDARGATVTNPNPNYNPDGYLWAVDIPAADAGSTVTVSIYDPTFGPNSALSESYSGTSVGFDTSYQLFAATGSLANYSIDQSMGMNSAANGPAGGTQGLNLCTGGTLGYKDFPTGTTSQNAWYALCTFNVSNTWQGGIYPLQVKTSAIPGVTDSGTGFNAYSVKASSTGTASVSVYGLNNLSIWTPASGTTRFYLASISQAYAGHTLVVDLYDPGDGAAGNYFMQFLQPPSGSPAYAPTSGTPTACMYSAPTANQGGLANNSSANCNIQTRSGSGMSQYNERWLRVQIAIPTTYTCSTDCWWTIKYDFGTAVPTDRTVWVANVLGDPVHLVG